ncbi:murein L,D-transpeptidase catalytic domain family protein [Hymenobacter rubripertinctus]|uniref:Murein L,D-transpeptidase catalytic domain family protein n=1 Tax=Hymenobacter rubripertinctus TaxID=2029981 RepID=A0A418R9A9_9BACT|nr:murein L,D-transpeptidase catalytic domain family protein [Hymenobacter rubripertinctus]RIY13875.1 hypothetical protein D0T11_01990 [Hymenobacter rubripertinctus]
MPNLPTITAGLFLTCFSCLLPAGAAPARPPALPATASRIASAPEATAPTRLSVAERAAYTAAFEQNVAQTYVQANLMGSGLPVQVYRKALIGFYNLQQRGLISARCHTLSIIDFSQSSTRERLWVIDLSQGRLVHHSLVAHGKNTGEEFARTFSNREGSEMSSLGFYVTSHTYQGKHGLSLRLEGVDAGYNTNARSRAVVVHGADYVSPAFVQRHGRLGRSQGCPALPSAEAPAIIRRIKDGTVVFAHGPEEAAYHSSLLELDAALLAFAQH